MDHINLIAQTLKPHLRWHGARLKFLGLFLVALFRVKTVNLSHIATAFANNIQIDSNYKRLQRFLSEFDMDYYHFAKVIVDLINIPEPWVYVGATRLKDNSLLIVISGDYEDNLLSDYAKRWGIETLFGIFKTRGFNLEDTHLKDTEKLSRLFALLTLALCWAYNTGEWLSQHKPITIKKHGRKSKSTFRYGLDYIRRIVFNLQQFRTDFSHCVRFLSCT